MEITQSHFLTLDELNEFMVHEDSNHALYRVPITKGQINTNRSKNDLLKTFRSVTVKMELPEIHIQWVTCFKS